VLYLVDVRAQEEYKSGHIAGAVCLPGGQALQAGDENFAVRSGHLVFVCDDGARSTVTAGWYARMGFPHACFLAGGLHGWEAAGLPLDRGSAAHSVPFGLQDARRSARAITPPELTERLEGGQALVLDVGTSRAYARGHVPGSRWLPRARLEERLPSIEPNPSREIVTVCADGITSTLAARALSEAGYSNVAVLAGGLSAWQQHGLPYDEGLTDLTGEPDDIVLPPFDRGREAMLRYLTWEEELGHKYEPQLARRNNTNG
jgi:rhodanese-related sulfurtransferase